MEAYYADELAVLFPFYHIAYWMGLVSNDGLYPNFKWLDYNTRAPGEGWSWGLAISRQIICILAATVVCCRGLMNQSPLALCAKVLQQRGAHNCTGRLS